MKRIVAISSVICTLLFIYGGWSSAVPEPSSIEEVNHHLQREAIAYEVIDGTPLVIAEYGGVIFFDTLKLDYIAIDWPPFPRWQWTGQWQRIDNPHASATAKLSSHYGPKVLYGVINDDTIVEIHVIRDGLVIRQIPVSGPGFIVQVEDVKLTDTIVFLNTEGDRVEEVALMNSVRLDSDD